MEKEFIKAKEELISLYLNIKVRTQEEVRQLKYLIKQLFKTYRSNLWTKKLY